MSNLFVTCNQNEELKFDNEQLPQLHPSEVRFVSLVEKNHLRALSHPEKTQQGTSFTLTLLGTGFIAAIFPPFQKKVACFLLQPLFTGKTPEKNWPTFGDTSFAPPAAAPRPFARQRIRKIVGAAGAVGCAGRGRESVVGVAFALAAGLPSLNWDGRKVIGKQGEVYRYLIVEPEASMYK